MQVSETTLFWLAAHLNHTKHAYTAPLSPSTSSPYSTQAAPTDTPVTRTYLLDVNPHATSRVNGDGFNIIDARWISVSDGLYIDITALSETEPVESPGVLSCKNFHSYRRRHLWPLRETEFEGVRAWVPFAYRTVIAGEYETEAMVRTEWEGYRWSEERVKWVKMEEGGARNKGKEKGEEEEEQEEEQEEEEEEERERENRRGDRRKEKRVAMELGAK